MTYERTSRELENQLESLLGSRPYRLLLEIREAQSLEPKEKERIIVDALRSRTSPIFQWYQDEAQFLAYTLKETIVLAEWMVSQLRQISAEENNYRQHAFGFHYMRSLGYLYSPGSWYFSDQLCVGNHLLDSTLGRIASLFLLLEDSIGDWDDLPNYEPLNHYLGFQLALTQLYRVSVVETDNAFVSLFEDELVMLVLCDLKLPLLVAPDGSRGWILSRFADETEGADGIDFMEESLKLLSRPVFNLSMPYAAVVKARLDAIAQQQAHFDFPWESWNG